MVIVGYRGRQSARFQFEAPNKGRSDLTVFPIPLHNAQLQNIVVNIHLNHTVGYIQPFLGCKINDLIGVQIDNLDLRFVSLRGYSEITGAEVGGKRYRGF